MNVSDLKVIAVDQSGYTHLATQGNLEGLRRTNDGDAKHALAALLGENWTRQRLLLDFHKTDYLDSNAIGWLIATNKSLKNDGGKLVIHSVPGRVQQIFKMLNLDSVIPQAPDAASGSKLLVGANG